MSFNMNGICTQLQPIVMQDPTPLSTLVYHYAVCPTKGARLDLRLCIHTGAFAAVKHTRRNRGNG